MFNRNHIGSSFNPIPIAPNTPETPHPSSANNQPQLSHNATIQLTPARSISDREASSRHRFHPYRDVPRLSVTQQRAARINARLQQQYGLQFIGPLPNLGEADYYQITSALDVLGNGHRDKSGTLATLHHLCKNQDKDAQINGFQTALTLMHYRILCSEQKYGILGETMLHLSAHYCEDPDIILRLISEQDMDINEENTEGDTSVHLAAQYNNNPDILNTLLSLEGDPHIPNNDGMKPIQVAAMGSKQPKIFTVLQTWGADINILDDQGSSLLHLAVICENLRATIALLALGFSPDKENNNDDTPLSIAMDAAFIDPQIVYALTHPNKYIQPPSH